MPNGYNNNNNINIGSYYDDDDDDDDNSYFIQSTWKMFRFGYDSVLLTNSK